jgi:hypothetical protein
MMTSTRLGLILFVLVTGCQSEDGSGVCQDKPAPAAPDGCVAGGLAGVDLQGTWTFNGTMEPSPAPMSFPITIERQGSGWCTIGLARGSVKGPPIDIYGYTDDTHASRDFKPSGTDTYADESWYICKDASGALVFHERDTFYADTLNHVTFDGVLTR